MRERSGGFGRHWSARVAGAELHRGCDAIGSVCEPLGVRGVRYRIQDVSLAEGPVALLDDNGLIFDWRKVRFAEADDTGSDVVRLTEIEQQNVVFFVVDDAV